MANNNETTTLRKVRNLLTLVILSLGVLLIVLAIGAEALGLDVTPGFGIVQTFQALVGLTCLTLAGFLYLNTLRDPDSPRSLQADVGVRLAATGLVFAFIIGLADLIGIGTHVNPRFERPYVGPFQVGGLILAVIMILAGMVLYYTSRSGRRKKSSMEFLVNGNGEARNNH